MFKVYRSLQNQTLQGSFQCIKTVTYWNLLKVKSNTLANNPTNKHNKNLSRFIGLCDIKLYFVHEKLVQTTWKTVVLFSIYTPTQRPPLQWMQTWGAKHFSYSPPVWKNGQIEGGKLEFYNMLLIFHFLICVFLVFVKQKHNQKISSIRRRTIYRGKKKDITKTLETEFVFILLSNSHW